MIKYFFESFMQLVGYRKVWYYPSKYGLPMADYSKWVFRPDLAPGVYSEFDLPKRGW